MNQQQTLSTNQRIIPTFQPQPQAQPQPHQIYQSPQFNSLQNQPVQPVQLIPLQTQHPTNFQQAQHVTHIQTSTSPPNPTHTNIIVKVADQKEDLLRNGLLCCILGILCGNCCGLICVCIGGSKIMNHADKECPAYSLCIKLFFCISVLFVILIPITCIVLFVILVIIGIATS